MKISDRIVDEIKSEINTFLQNHNGISEKEKNSLSKVPVLMYLLNQLYLNRNLPLDTHQRVSAAIKYINSNYDFMSADFSGAIGSVDDIMVSAVVLKKVDHEINLENYCDRFEDLQKICDVLIEVADKYLPERITQKIRRDFS